MQLRFLLFRAVAVTIALQSLGSVSLANNSSAFLGDPEVDVESARKTALQRKAQCLNWELATTVQAYDQIGSKNARWDAAARDALTLQAKSIAGDCNVDCDDQVHAAFQKAIAAGCDDPLVFYFSLRSGLYPSDISALDLAKLYASAEERLRKSGYPSIRKCYASVRAAEQAIKVMNRISGSQQMEIINSIFALLSRAEADFEDLLRDPSTNRDSVYALEEKAFLDVARDANGLKQVFEPLQRFFELNRSKITGDAPGSGLIEGDFWIEFAWFARGTGWGSSVRQECWRLFGERLEKAQAVLEKAWAADQHDPNIAIQMMTVELGQGLGRERLETWFRRAMDADPDSCEAAQKKLLYLLPKWHGSEEEVMQFARQCFETQNWTSRIPFVLISAHCDLASDSEKPSEYWKRPEVWSDVEKLYSQYFTLNPNSCYDRSYYALAAFRAEKWKLANELFASLGDRPNLQALNCSMQQYQRMRKTAEAHVQDQ